MNRFTTGFSVTDVLWDFYVQRLSFRFSAKFGTSGDHWFVLVQVIHMLKIVGKKTNNRLDILV